MADFGRGWVTGYIAFFPLKPPTHPAQSGGWDLNLSTDTFTE